MESKKKFKLLPQVEKVHLGSGIIKEGQLVSVQLAICDLKGGRNAKIICLLSLRANISMSVFVKLAENNSVPHALLCRITKPFAVFCHLCLSCANV